MKYLRGCRPRAPSCCAVCAVQSAQQPWLMTADGARLAKRPATSPPFRDQDPPKWPLAYLQAFLRFAMPALHCSLAPCRCCPAKPGSLIQGAVFAHVNTHLPASPHCQHPCDLGAHSLGVFQAPPAPPSAAAGCRRARATRQTFQPTPPRQCRPPVCAPWPFPHASHSFCEWPTPIRAWWLWRDLSPKAHTHTHMQGALDNARTVLQPGARKHPRELWQSAAGKACRPSQTGEGPGRPGRAGRGGAGRDAVAGTAAG
jgi:hypothetical protein